MRDKRETIIPTSFLITPPLMSGIISHRFMINDQDQINFCAFDDFLLSATFTRRSVSYTKISIPAMLGMIALSFFIFEDNSINIKSSEFMRVCF